MRWGHTPHMLGMHRCALQCHGLWKTVAVHEEIEASKEQELTTDQKQKL